MTTTDEILENIYGDSIPNGVRSMIPELIRRRYAAGVCEEVTPAEIVNMSIVYDLVVKAMKGKSR